MSPKDKRQKIVIIAGATASGKSALAVIVAQQFNGEVISADSRQVYRGLDIGTAKTTAAQMLGVPHHLIDICDISTTYTAVDFKRDAVKAIDGTLNRGGLPIIAGGTFFYVDVLLNRISPAPVLPNWDLRANLEKKSLAELGAELEKKDPQRYQHIDRQNKRRLIRALEITHTLDYVPIPLVPEFPYQVLTIAISATKEELRDRYQERAQSWLKTGFKEEVQGLLKMGISRLRLREIGFEYQVMLELIDGEITETQFVQKFIEKNWQYAKRQLLWLKKDESIVWVDHDDQFKVFTQVKNFLKDQ